MLANCIESVLASGVPPEQIVLVDNGSRDGSAASLAARHPSLEIILNDCNSGFARAANQGLFGAETPYGIILNNDASISVDAPDTLAHAFATDPLLRGWPVDLPGRQAAEFGRVVPAHRERFAPPAAAPLYPREPAIVWGGKVIYNSTIQ